MVAAVKQSLFDFYNSSVDFSTNQDCNEIFDVLRAYGAEGPLVSKNLGADHGYFYLFLGGDGGHWSIRSYSTGLVSIDVTQIENSNGEIKIPSKILKDLHQSLKDKLSCKNARHLPPIIRDGPFNPYLNTSDDRLAEYDIDRVVVEEDSEFQNIKILHSESYGNILVLDNDLNLAESDLPYTDAITGQGREDYTDKTVLILGGGDGGILHELRKQNPKSVVMVEIDKVVINYARQHLRGICGDSLDSLKGANYEVIIDDCIKVMNEYIKEGSVFDYVINDLTAIPITTEPKGSMWDFLRHILDLSMKVLSPKGKYFTQGNGFSMPESLKMYEDQLSKLECPVEYKKHCVSVPSYLEMWVFYEIWKKETAMT